MKQLICKIFGHEPARLEILKLSGSMDVHKHKCSKCGNEFGTLGFFTNSEAFFPWDKDYEGMAESYKNGVKRWQEINSQVAQWKR